MCRFYHVIHPFQRLKKERKNTLLAQRYICVLIDKITVLLLMFLSAIKFCHHWKQLSSWNPLIWFSRFLVNNPEKTIKNLLENFWFAIYYIKKGQGVIYLINFITFPQPIETYTGWIICYIRIYLNFLIFQLTYICI